MDNELVLLRATVAKLRGERKVMHEMLTKMGVPDDVLGDGVKTCLIGRMAIAIGYGDGVNPSDTTCTCILPEQFEHEPGCAVWK